MNIDEKLSQFRQEQQKQQQISNSNKSASNNQQNSSFGSYFSSWFTSKKSENAEIPAKNQIIETDKLENNKINEKLSSEELRKRNIQLAKQRLNLLNNSKINRSVELNNQQDEDETIESSFNKLNFIKILLHFLLWLSLFIIFIRIEFGLVYFVCSLLVIIYLNTNVKRRKGFLSAYSVFNPNVERLPGQLTSEQLEKSLIRGF
jgi:hypothetical protein